MGCGHGDFLKPVYDKTIHSYGIDPDEEALDKNTFIKDKKVGVVERLPFESNFFWPCSVCMATWALTRSANSVSRNFSEYWNPTAKSFSWHQTHEITTSGLFVLYPKNFMTFLQENSMITKNMTHTQNNTKSTRSKKLLKCSVNRFQKISTYFKRRSFIYQF